MLQWLTGVLGHIPCHSFGGLELIGRHAGDVNLPICKDHPMPCHSSRRIAESLKVKIAVIKYIYSCFNIVV
jgi:hypothetical protein